MLNMVMLGFVNSAPTYTRKQHQRRLVLTKEAQQIKAPHKKNREYTSATLLGLKSAAQPTMSSTIM